ncbi:lytic transglycosylase domain-containing protein [Rummeliibacillus sp. TYF-LIM-RU47]|uniref:lytic transglycosylase domain-containing protein n=1 Tax=Rummeliibacillus sp. TYF-LIM-RU47 TaxID=2608406 RepID=UPI0012386127|nr:lytic transglycosylase domain-containing protein [Rummeliibacillus sp. TYF-LIM-RU47]
MNIQSILPYIQSLNTNTADINGNNTTNSFANMMGQYTGLSTESSDTSQMLGMSNALSNTGTQLLQLLSSSGMQNSNLASAFNPTQLLGSLGSLSNSANSLYYNGTSPVYTPATMNYTNGSSSALNATQQPVSAAAGSGPQTSFDGLITKASNMYGIPEKMIKSVIKQESGFNPSATSSAGAGGLMQLMPSTAKFLGVSNVYDAEQNIMGGTKYLKQLFDKFGGNYDLMLAGYNAGPGAVAKYGGVPPYKETMNYVQSIMNTFNA